MALPQRLDDNVVSFRKERSRADLALELTRGFAWEYDIKTGELYRSHDASTLFGRPVGSIAPTLEAYLEHVHPDDREKIKSAVRDAISTRTGYDLEYRILWADGSVHWMAGRGRILLDRKGNPSKLIGVDIDVSERKSLQQLVIDSERLVALGRISATLAHELNNPLAAMQNALYLLEHSGGLSPYQQEILGLAQTEMRRCAEIIHSTLSIQRVSSTPVAADPRSLTDEVLTLFRARLLRQMIQVKKKYRDVPKLLVQPGQIRQVLVNVIGNAVDAMPAGGVLAIGIAPWKTNSTREVRMLICDSGHGIERDKRSRVFEPFFTTKGPSGSGIGLWISKQIVERHGGEIRLRSCQGKELNGTCVRISLPIEH